MLENSYPIRTDLALESQERLQEDQADMRGIRVLEERRENGVIVSTVMIETENASVAMGAVSSLFNGRKDPASGSGLQRRIFRSVCDPHKKASAAGCNGRRCLFSLRLQ